MVILESILSPKSAISTSLGWFAAAEKPLLERLEPQERARVTLLFVGVIILGVLMVTIVWLLGRYWRRQIRKPLPSIRPQGDEWAAKPLTPIRPPVSDEPR